MKRVCLILALLVLCAPPVVAAPKSSGMIPKGALLPDVYPLDAKARMAATLSPAVVVDKDDPCYPHAMSRESYAACHDRHLKIERMKAANAARRAALQGVRDAR